MVRMRSAEPRDDYMHTVEDVSNFNESAYYNVFDPSRQIGGWFRLGNRPNEGYAEMTTCIYLPDRSVAFMFFRPKIDNNDAFDAGGMRFEVVEAGSVHDVSYRGKVAVLRDPSQMVDPGRAFKDNPMTECELKVRFRAVSPMWGGEPVNDDGSPITQSAEQGFARGHFEQHLAGSGTIRVSGDQFTIDGFGLRDHSWGPRYWQNVHHYRWLTANFGEDFGFALNCNARGGGGMLLKDGRYEIARDGKLETEWSPDFYQERLRVTFRTDDREYEVEGNVLSLIPLRNRRTSPSGDELMTRITEGMTEYRCDGRTGYGLSEYLDQIVDGKPVGIEAGAEGAPARS